MSTVVISSKGQIVLPNAVRKALGLQPGMRVEVTLDGKAARLTPLAANTATLEETQALLDYSGPVVPISAMRMTGHKA
jgi:AbrB family looped-hinge helix DNA binding protein